MKQKKLRITQEDFILANRKAAREEEIERHGRQVQSRRMVHKSKKTYDRNRLKRAVITSDDGSIFLGLASEMKLLPQGHSSGS